MTHRTLALPLLVAAIVGLSACSSQRPGSPTAAASSTTGSPSSRAGADPLASVDPCSLITSAELASNGLQPGKIVNAPGARACSWNRPDDGATIDGYLIQIAIYDTAGLDQLNTSVGTASDYSVGKYQGKLLRYKAGLTCTVALGITSTSRIDIDVITSTSVDQSCTLVERVAPAVVSHFPAGA